MTGVVVLGAGTVVVVVQVVVEVVVVPAVVATGVGGAVGGVLGATVDELAVGFTTATTCVASLIEPSFLSSVKGPTTTDNATTPPTIWPHNGQLRYFAQPLWASSLSLSIVVSRSGLQASTVHLDTAWSLRIGGLGGPSPLPSSFGDAVHLDAGGYKEVRKRVRDAVQQLSQAYGIVEPEHRRYKWTAKTDAPKVVARARVHGLAAVTVVNLFSWRATQPSDHKEAAKAGRDIVGTRTDEVILELSHRASITLAAWGASGTLRNRGAQVTRLLDHPICLGVTRNGEPLHPLYVPAATETVPYGRVE